MTIRWKVNCGKQMMHAPPRLRGILDKGFFRAWWMSSAETRGCCQQNGKKLTRARRGYHNERGTGAELFVRDLI